MTSGREFVRAVRGPIIQITVGTLFALDHFTPWTFNQTWPVILIVVGLLTLAGRMAGPGSAPGAPSGPASGPTSGATSGSASGATSGSRSGMS